MEAVKKMILKVARSNSTVLIRGESGTGKELIARAIHNQSPRASEMFQAVNCAAINENLLESELFGHEKGSFTGAHADKKGLFEVADRGTLFLDEIAELDVSMQAKLLRALQERRIRRVGATFEIPVDVRVVAATNRDLRAMVGDGRFRDDLYYRINVLSIDVPPLRERREDIPLLVERFLESACAETHRRGITVDQDVIAAFQAYDWPGNVRELMNIVRRLVALATSPRIAIADLPEPIRRASRGALVPLERVVGLPSVSDREPDSAAGDSDPELRRLLSVVNSARTMADAAALLGVTRSTLYRRLERYGLQ
jgi:transcriptional regulator with PAS, ATPase and Fis domain